MESKTILIVEDSQDDKDLSLRAFKKSNVQAMVVVLQDGAEALDYMNCTGAYSEKPPFEVPDLILLDLKLPKIDGKEVLEAFRNNKIFKLIPVIVLSSSGERNDLNDCYALGVNSYIKKPIDFKHFLEIIELTIHYWFNINEQPRL
jgi:two-component system response regulator